MLSNITKKVASILYVCSVIYSMNIVCEMCNKVFLGFLSSQSKIAAHTICSI